MTELYRLTRPLLLEEAQRVGDGAGGFRRVWVVLGTLWADVQPGTGRERSGEFVTLSSLPFSIIVRAAVQGAPSRPKADQRFRDGTRLFRILAVTEDGPGGQFLVCHAREEIPA